ncbi:MAG: L-threonylcarbamoyladenylate synthase [Candidatus Nanopelagicales bacterium]
MFDCRDPATRDSSVDIAITKLRRGRVAVLPDDALYLMAADAFSDAGVTRIRYLKNRDDAPLSVLIGAPATVDGIATRIAPWARDLMHALWPGPLTLVLRRQPSLVWPLGGSGVSVRMPLHPVTLAVVRALGPTAVTSANRPGLAPATTCEEVHDQFDRDLDLYLDTGPAPFAYRSTIVDCTGDHPILLRPGEVSADSIEQIAGSVEVGSVVERPGGPESAR